MFGIYFLLYEVLGVLLVTAACIVEVVCIARKYGEPVLERLTAWVEEQNKSFCGGDRKSMILAILIGILLWPFRLADAPAIFHELWEKAEEINNELANNKTES